MTWPPVTKRFASRLVANRRPGRALACIGYGAVTGNPTGRRNSSESEPQMRISKEGNEYLRTLLVQGAHYIFGPFGDDSDLRRWGQKLAERGGKNAKKRAVVAVARKLAVLLHRLGEWRGVRTAAQYSEGDAPLA